MRRSSRYCRLVIVMLLMVLPVAVSIMAKTNWDADAEKRKADYVFLEAQRQNAIEHEDAYYELLDRAYHLDRSNTDVASVLGYFKIVLSGNDSTLFKTGYEMLGHHFEEKPSDFYGSYLYGNVNDKLGFRKEALRVWATLDSLYPDKIEIAFKYAEALSASRDSADRAKAFDVYSRIERAEGKSLQVSSRKIRMYFSARDTLAVIDEMNQLLQSSPTSAEYNVFAGDLYSLFAKNDSALHYYSRACEVDSTSGLAYYSRANFYKNTGDSVAYDREVFRALKQDNLDLESKLKLLTSYIKELYEDPTQQPRIQDLFAVLIEQHPHEVDIHDLYCSYLVAIKDYAGAAEQAGYILDIDPSDEERWRMLISLYMQDEDYERSAAEGEKAIHYHPNSEMLYLVTATDYMQLKNYDKALNYLNKSLELTDSADYEMRSQILCTIGDTYYTKEEKDSAFYYYDRALELDPGNLLALNNCAYYLACEGRDLDRAERMSAITVREQPENSTSLDTYAWVFFKKGNYVLAKQYIDAALNYSDEPSGELFHHAGDIYFMSGEPDKALEYWNQAIELEPDNELLQKKVKHKTYFYK